MNHDDNTFTVKAIISTSSQRCNHFLSRKFRHVACNYEFWPMPHKIEKVSRKRLVRDFFDVEKVFIQTPNETFDRMLCLTKSAVVVLVHNLDEDCFYFVRQMRTCRVEEHDPTVLELPAGMIESEEHLLDTAKRECEEEIGFSPTEVQYKGWAWSAPGLMTEKMHYCFAEVRNQHKIGEGGGLDSEHEAIEVVSIPVKKVYEQLKQNQFCDAKTLACLWRYFAERPKV